MKVRNMTSSKGNKIANQFIIEEKRGDVRFELFQSYDSLIAKRWFFIDGETIELDQTYWDYSKTTGKYRNQFLGETKAETQRKIESGEYILTDLNG